MKIRLLAPDSKIPNYAIMKISTYHKRLGDDVDWYSHFFDYVDTDILYISKIFTFSPEPQYLPINAKIIKGGTGYDLVTKLPEEIESITELDYGLYPDCDYSIMFTTRGCIRKCPFCVVPTKEGIIHKADLPNLNPKGKYIKILDNNFFSYKGWRENIETLKSFNQPLDFNTGIDLRILTEDHAKALATCKIKQIHCAWDNYKDKEVILPKLELLTKYVKPYKITTYVLVGYENKEIVETDLERVMTLKNMKVNPFAMGYIDFNNPKHTKTRSVRDFCRWVNMKATFKSVSWEDYRG
jgi:hypothetical protein